MIRVVLIAVLAAKATIASKLNFPANIVAFSIPQAFQVFAVGDGAIAVVGIGLGG